MKKSLGQELLDQTAHFLIGYVAVIVIHPASLWQAALLGLALGLTREVTEGGNVFSAGSLRDLVSWTVGATCAGIVFL